MGGEEKQLTVLKTKRNKAIFYLFCLFFLGLASVADGVTECTRRAGLLDEQVARKDVDTNLALLEVVFQQPRQ